MLRYQSSSSKSARQQKGWGGREVKPFPLEGKMLQLRRVRRKAINRHWYTWGIITVAGHLLVYLLWHKDWEQERCCMWATLPRGSCPWGPATWVSLIASIKYTCSGKKFVKGPAFFFFSLLLYVNLFFRKENIAKHMHKCEEAYIGMLTASAIQTEGQGCPNEEVFSFHFLSTVNWLSSKPIPKERSSICLRWETRKHQK